MGTEHVVRLGSEHHPGFARKHSGINAMASGAADVAFERLREWIGRPQTHSDTVTPVPMAALAATLDLEMEPAAAGDPVPPLWHWLYFLPINGRSEIGADGHPTRGSFLPPVPLPRRLWVGSRCRFHHALRVGNTITRISRIAKVEHRQDRTGPFVFVRVHHEVRTGAGTAVVEEHDIAYRANPTATEAPPASKAAPRGHAWSRTIQPDSVMLFRYSALTFNSHRTHYDRRYVTEVVGYPGLVVHGPLIATLLLDLLHRHMPDAQIASFEFRALKLLFDNAPFTVCGKPANDRKSVWLWAKDAGGLLAMSATATLT